MQRDRARRCTQSAMKQAYILRYIRQYVVKSEWLLAIVLCKSTIALAACAVIPAHFSFDTRRLRACLAFCRESTIWNKFRADSSVKSMQVSSSVFFVNFDFKPFRDSFIDGLRQLISHDASSPRTQERFVFERLARIAGRVEHLQQSPSGDIHQIHPSPQAP